jgi:alkaline phosphatase
MFRSCVPGFVLGTAAALAPFPILAQQREPTSVVFLHPDGMGANTWAVVRTALHGPDGRLNWDRFPHAAVYLGHMKDALAATSHGGATVHAFGVKVPANSYGMDGTGPVTSRSGQPMSLLLEARASGRAVGIVNSGTITEPGTGAWPVSSTGMTTTRSSARCSMPRPT